MKEEGENSTLDNPRRIAWFDENGQFLGNVEMEFSTENFPRLRQAVETTEDGAEKILLVFEDRLIPMEDGLWMSGQLQAAEVENDDIGSKVAFDFGLFRVPEP